MDSATTTSVETATVSASVRRTDSKTPSKVVIVTKESTESSHDVAGTLFIKKYRHVAAIHSQTRPSTLSHDSEAAPSFLGFRNLMVIFLGMFPEL